MELKGLKGIAAYQTYLRVMFYIRLVRETMETEGKIYGDLLAEFVEKSEKEKEQVLLELMAISPMQDNDVMRLCAVHSDINGIPYSKNNIGNLTAHEGMQLCLKTLIACSQSGEDLFF